MKKIDNDTFEFENGRIIHPDCGLWGLGQREIVSFNLSEIDSNMFAYPMKRHDPDEPDLTIDEAKEVAEYMIEEWIKFRDSLK